MVTGAESTLRNSGRITLSFCFRYRWISERFRASVGRRSHSSLCLSPDLFFFANSSSFDGTPPPHFYGELVKTEEGCQILEASGHFLEFAAFIRQHGLEEEDNRIIRELKSVLWAVVRRDLDHHPLTRLIIFVVNLTGIDWNVEEWIRILGNGIDHTKYC
jgi:hypothetical protein